MFLLSTLLLGCMPDSLTKFKKDAETKPAAPPASTVITTEEGETFDLADVQNITNFHYLNSNNVSQSTFYSKTNSVFTISPVTDGTFGIAPENLKERLFLSCTISPALPYGMTFSNKSTSPCKIDGTPSTKSFVNVSGQLNAPISYTVTLKTRGKDGLTTTSLASIQIGIYDDVVDFKYAQDDLVILRTNLTNPEVLNNVVANNNPSTDYLASGFLTSANGITGVIKSIDREQNIIGVKKLVPLKLFSYSAFETAVASPNENVGLSTPMFICAQNGAMAKVIRVPKSFSSDTILVEMITSTKFLLGSSYRIELIKPNTTVLGSNPVEALCGLTPLAYSMPIYILPNTLDYSFDDSAPVALDFNIQFYEKKADLTAAEMAFEINQNIGTVPTVYPAITVKTNQFDKMTNSTNGVIYSVSPPLPAGFTISPTTGELTGKFTSTFNHSTYTITAKNPVSEVKTTLTLNSLHSPRDLSYTTNQFFSINRFDDIYEGIKLEESITPPLAPESAKIATVLNKYYDQSAVDPLKRYKLSVNTLNGKINYLARLKVANSLATEIPLVNSNDVANYNLALPVVGEIPLSYSAGQYIKAGNDAFARITYVFRSSTTRNVIFAQQVKLNTDSSMPRFTLGLAGTDTICRTDANRSNAICNDPLILHSVESNNLVLETSTVPPINTQFQFVSNNNFSSGKLEDYATNLYLLSEIGQSPRVSADLSTDPYPLATSHYLKAGNTINFLSPSDTLSAATTVSRTYAAANIFILERDEYVEIQPNILNATYSNYIIIPSLPPGLTLNSNTGVITGKPTVRTQRLTYKVIAMNLVGQSTYDLELEVKDFFRVKNINKISSQNMHLAGLNKSSRDCKIDVNEISKRGYVGTADIFDTSCILDVEESDLYNRGINLQISVGDSVCTDVEFEPYSFQQFRPIATSPSAFKYYKFNGCTPAALPAPYLGDPSWIYSASTPDPANNSICGGNYTSSQGPNCDTGSVIYVEESWSLDDASNCVRESTTQTTIQCGGNKYNCRQGAIRDVIAEAEIQKNITKVFEDSWTAGLTKAYPIMSPKVKGLKSNLHIANGVTNVCTTARDHTQALLAYSAATADTDSTFGQSNPYYSFYCKNAAGTTLARIKVVVREWDVNYYLTSFIDIFNPDPLLTPTALNNNTPTGYGAATFNDFNSWDNLTTASPAPTACTTPADTLPLTLRYLYPRDEY